MLREKQALEIQRRYYTDQLQLAAAGGLHLVTWMEQHMRAIASATTTASSVPWEATAPLLPPPPPPPAGPPPVLKVRNTGITFVPGPSTPYVPPPASPAAPVETPAPPAPEQPPADAVPSPQCALTRGEEGLW